MRLYYQDFSWAGAVCVVAKNEEQARILLAEQKKKNPRFSYYEEAQPLESVAVGEVLDIMGDR